MGSGSSRVVSLSDASRVRDWLLVVLHRHEDEGQPHGEQLPLRAGLIAFFQRYDTSASGVVALSAVAEIASELSLSPPSTVWSTDEIAQFCAFFAADAGEHTGDTFAYDIFLDYLLFPVQLTPPRVEISSGDISAAGFRIGVYSTADNHGRLSIKKPVVIKAVALARSIDAREEESVCLRDAVNNLRLVSHPNLVSYCSTLQCSSTLYVLQSHEQKCCTLRTILESFGPMKESTIRRYLVQLLQGLRHLHKLGVSHGALSTQSVLIDSYGLLKLADFGLRRYFPSSSFWDRLPELPATGDEADWCMQYMPPETEGKATWGPKGDVWCIGILALQMMHGYNNSTATPHSSSSSRVPHCLSPTKQPASNSTSTKEAAVVRLPALPATASKELKALIQSCLRRKPSKRATVGELLRSTYLLVDQTEATREELRTVCTDLDASMRRLLSASSPSTRAGVRKDVNMRRAPTGRRR